jgi:signal transduction histidine kinase
VRPFTHSGYEASKVTTLLGASLSTASDAVGFVVGLLEVALAAVVVRYLFRFGRAFPWLAALLVFFVLRGTARVYETFSAQAVAEIDLALDAFIILVILLLIGGLERTVAGLKLAFDEAALRRREYERALVDYRTLARHRLANPIAAIVGSVEALELKDVDAETRQRLLEILRTEALRLRQVALEPEPLGPEERSLQPKPLCETSRARGRGCTVRRR